MLDLKHVDIVKPENIQIHDKGNGDAANKSLRMEV
jgi:hypothetical protein